MLLSQEWETADLGHNHALLLTVSVFQNFAAIFNKQNLTQEVDHTFNPSRYNDTVTMCHVWSLTQSTGHKSDPECNRWGLWIILIKEVVIITEILIQLTTFFSFSLTATKRLNTRYRIQALSTSAVTNATSAFLFFLLSFLVSWLFSNQTIPFSEFNYKKYAIFSFRILGEDCSTAANILRKCGMAE